MADYHRLRGFQDNLSNILGIWLIVTSIIVTMVLNNVLPWVISQSSTAFVDADDHVSIAAFEVQVADVEAPARVVERARSEGASRSCPTVETWG